MFFRGSLFMENIKSRINEKTKTVSQMDYVGKHYVENIGNSTVTIVLKEIK